MDNEAGVAVFRVCGSCRRSWRSWEEFVTDPEVRLLGLQAVFTVPDSNLLVFEHRCGSSVSIFTSRLHHLLPDHPAAAWPSLRGTHECPGHCLSLADLAACDRPCRNTLDRDLLELVRYSIGARLGGAAAPASSPPSSTNSAPVV